MDTRKKFEQLINFDPNNPPELLNIEDRRAFGHEIYDIIRQHAVRPELGSCVDREIESAAGPVPVRIYRPIHESRGIYLYFHGGGWTTGSIDDVEPHCAHVCVDAEVTVINVGYRLAPEHPFPAAVEDAFAALVWADRNRADLATDEAPILVAGMSAGANIAAVVTAMARDRGGPRIAFQYLDVPALDATMSQPSVTAENAFAGVLNPDALRVAYLEYLGDSGAEASPYVSPLLAPDLKGLPPALIVTAEYDPLRDEGEAYANRLREAGVEVRHHRYPRAHHGFTALEFLHSVPGEAYQELIAAVRSCVSGAESLHSDD
jgi:acetyl esterase